MKKIAVIFGGKSAEHEVSIITAHLPIIQSLRASGQYDVYPVYITKQGVWHCSKDFLDLSYFQSGDVESRLPKRTRVELSLNDGLILVWRGLFPKRVSIDLVFTAMHGTYGEDGSLMGVLRMANVPFVGCDLFASAVAMDKVLTKQVLQAEGVPVVPYVWFTRHQWQRDREQLLSKCDMLTYPLFVKPVHLGSSIAITKVSDKHALEQAIEVALHYDTKVLVEEAVQNLIEVTLPIMGNDELTFAGIEEPLNKSEFFDFSDKYLSGGKGKNAGKRTQPYSRIPAEIDDDLATTVRSLGEKTYRTLGCSGIARIDFLIDQDSRTVYVNEVNTLPGGLYDHNWRHSGVSNVALVEKLIALAQEKFNAEKDTTYTFQSDVLKAVPTQKGG